MVFVVLFVVMFGIAVGLRFCCYCLLVWFIDCLCFRGFLYVWQSAFCCVFGGLGAGVVCILFCVVDCEYGCVYVSLWRLLVVLLYSCVLLRLFWFVNSVGLTLCIPMLFGLWWLLLVVMSLFGCLCF